MRVGITGSVGFLGANLVKHVHDNRPEGLDTICFYSRNRSNPLTDQLDLPHRHLDVTSRREVLEKTRDLDVLFHLAGMVDYSRKHARRTWEVNVLGARNIFQAVLRNRIPKLVFISSINVLGTAGRGTDLRDETNDPYGSPGNPISFRNRAETLAAVEASARGEYRFLARSRVPYFDSKLAAYELALDYHRKTGLPVTVVLPGTAVGQGDVGMSITTLVHLTYAGKLKITLPGGSSFVSARDVAEGIWLSSLRGKAGQGYIITGPPEDNLSYRAFMERVAGVARHRYGQHVSGRFLSLPAPLCRPVAGAFRLLSIDGALSEGLILSGCATHRFSHAKARDELGYRPKVTLDQAIESCIDFHLQKLAL
jgi:nucleoside-diphosphate-sugar epimerase